MIRAEVREEGVAFVEAPSNAVAYIDRDWLPDSSGVVPSLSISSEGVVAWCDETPVQVPDLASPDSGAALVFLAVAREIATAVEGLPPSSIEVTGRGLIAAQVRLLIGRAGQDGSDGSEDRPRAIVDTTGDPATIVGATRRVQDLGTIVLAGDPRASIDMNLYSDVHLRGLTLVGIGPPLRDGVFPGPTATGDEALVDVALASLHRSAEDEPVPLDVSWYGISGS